jgi:hypothetical protein
MEEGDKICCVTLGSLLMKDGNLVDVGTCSLLEDSDKSKSVKSPRNTEMIVLIKR